MKFILSVINIIKADRKAPVGYQDILLHIIYDEKRDFARKGRFVAGGPVTRPPTTPTYARFISRDSV
jgi:hypothetical protein